MNKKQFEKFLIPVFKDDKFENELLKEILKINSAASYNSSVASFQAGLNKSLKLYRDIKKKSR